MSVPPLSDLALPMEDTLMSIICPGWAKAGNCAVTITAATFLSCNWFAVPGGRLMPICCR
ncbi:hypothetical protein D3C71_1445520 [compost metagenome]